MAKRLFTTLILICAFLACLSQGQENTSPDVFTHLPETKEEKKTAEEKENGETTTEEFWDCK
jgi:hypothetical protein